MTLTDELQVVDDKIKANQAQNDLDINQVLLDKLNLNILHQVQSLIKAQMRMIIKKDFYKS